MKRKQRAYNKNIVFKDYQEKKMHVFRDFYFLQ